MIAYQAVYGDSPARIAARYGVPVAALLAANPHKPTTYVGGVRTWRDLRVGERLRVPTAGAAAVEQFVPPGERRGFVRERYFRPREFMGVGDGGRRTR